jgi:hypothetical protein
MARGAWKGCTGDDASDEAPLPFERAMTPKAALPIARLGDHQQKLLLADDRCSLPVTVAKDRQFGSIATVRGQDELASNSR